MEAAKEYILSITAAALICGIAVTLIGEKGVVGKTVKFVAGLLMFLVVMSPLTGISIGTLSHLSGEVSEKGANLATVGAEIADVQYRTSIKQQLESYILEEARALGAELSVEIVLATDQVPVPERVFIAGEISPYGRQVLTTILTERLGISREEQIWT